MAVSTAIPIQELILKKALSICRRSPPRTNRCSQTSRPAMAATPASDTPPKRKPPVTIASLVIANPAGLYRVEMMHAFAGPEVLADLGMTAALPGPVLVGAIWACWVLLPSIASGAILSRAKVP